MSYPLQAASVVRFSYSTLTERDRASSPIMYVVVHRRADGRGQQQKKKSCTHIYHRAAVICSVMRRSDACILGAAAAACRLWNASRRFLSSISISRRSSLAMWRHRHSALQKPCSPLREGRNN
uniref:Uncharacterized protein n=2 Tax=Zea mays TaxID=4577 RepID=C4J2I8_MAIZE|nr:unknown [Zea mays]